MNKQKTIIFFGAHPDDETFGPGATLAKYAINGVKVYYVCATRGEQGLLYSEYMKNFATIADLRTSEMKCAAEALGLAEVIYLNYHDSGLHTDKIHANTLISVPIDQVVGKIVKIIRELKPDIVITHYADGGPYKHPDHVVLHNATVTAFFSSNDPTKYPEAGTTYQPAKLYFSVYRRPYLKLIAKSISLLRFDPTRFGRYKYNINEMIGKNYKVNTTIYLPNEAIKRRTKASMCHASQGGARPLPILFKIFYLLEKLWGPRDYFIKGYPPPNKKQERSFFESIE